MGKNITWKKVIGEAISSSLKYECCLEEYQVGKWGRGRNFRINIVPRLVGKLKISGNLGKAMALEKMMTKMQKSKL